MAKHFVLTVIELLKYLQLKDIYLYFVKSCKITQCKIETLLIAFYVTFKFKCFLQNPMNREFNMDKLSE